MCVACTADWDEAAARCPVVAARARDWIEEKQKYKSAALRDKYYLMYDRSEKSKTQ